MRREHNIYLCKECMAIKGTYILLCSLYGKCTCCKKIKPVEKFPEYLILKLAYREIKK